MRSRTFLILAIGALSVAGVLLACVSSPTPTGTDGEEPTVEGPPTWETVEAPPATAAGRSDCPADWLAHTDPRDHYSICYPADFDASSSGEDNLYIASQPKPDQSGVSLTVVWLASLGPGYGPPTSEACAEQTVMRQTSSSLIEIQVGGNTVDACFNQGLTEGEPGLPIASVSGAVAIAEDGSDSEGYIEFALYFSGPDVSRIPDVGESMLETLSVDKA